MNRSCPQCRRGSVSIVKLALLLRPRCARCNELVGFRVMFSAWIYVALSALLAFFYFYIIPNIAFPAGAVVWLSLLIVLLLAAASIGPLETKSSERDL